MNTTQSSGLRPAQGGQSPALKLETNDATAVNGMHSSSAPGTPQPLQGELRRQSTASPAQLQRRSSAQYQQRPGSSASPRLMRKGSRTSLGASPANDDNDRRLTPKRSISNLITELRGAQATMEAIPEPIILTAPQIAATCFERELAGHAEASASTLVLLHDACYGHRFSRLKTTKGTLSMIVERPERLLASVLGVATAYVRLGGFHAGARNAPHPRHTSTAPPPFKIRRTDRALDIKSPYVTAVHGTEWMSELHTLCSDAGAKLAAGEKEVARTKSITGEDKKHLHEGDLYLCQESLDAFQGALGGVADAVDAVFLPSMNTKRAFVAVRPPGHHCSADYPSGFCWINNVHVGIEYAAQTHNLTHAAIIDFDLHHGDGSQSIAWERNSKNNYRRLYAKGNSKLKLGPDIGYYSLHDINSYPCEMGDDEKVHAASVCVHNAHGQSIWNVHLQPWRTLEEFWQLYETQYSILLRKASEFLKHHTARIVAEGKQRPRSAIFISAGFDASEWEGEGMQRHKVNVPTEFYARFTQDILTIAEEEGTGCDGRVISVLEGGYSDRALCSSTLSHLSTLSHYKQDEIIPEVQTGLGLSMQRPDPTTDLDSQLKRLSINTQDNGYDVDWWSVANLTALEHHINPPPPLSAGGKKLRTGPQPTYATPTESFAYKVIDPAKFARSVSGTMREGSTPTRPTTPPPPEVDWIIAAHELSKLLIPIHRTTKSCTAEELAGPKVKKERHSDIGVSTSPDDLGKPRQLRTRGKNDSEQAAVGKRKVSNNDRRRTMADLPSAVAENDILPEVPRRASRRSSLASTTSTVSTALDAPPVPTIPRSTSAARPMPVSRTPSAGNVQVKKSRIPSQPADTKIKPVDAGRPASAQGRAGSAMTTRSPRKAAAPAPTPATPKTKPTQEASVDALASGMKRITLKVGSREENEKRAKEKLDAERRARALKGAETRRINKAAREAKAAEESKAAASALPEQAAPALVHAVDAGSPAQNVVSQSQQQVLPSQPQINGSYYEQQRIDSLQAQHQQQVAPVAQMTQTAQMHDNTGSGTNLYAASNGQQFMPPVTYQQPQHFPYGSDPRQPFPTHNTMRPVTVHRSGYPDIDGQFAHPHPTFPAGMSAQQLPTFTSTSHIPFASDGAVTAPAQYQSDWSTTHAQPNYAEQMPQNMWQAEAPMTYREEQEPGSHAYMPLNDAYPRNQ